MFKTNFTVFRFEKQDLIFSLVMTWICGTIKDIDDYVESML
jgi:hypothetical protein